MKIQSLALSFAILISLGAHASTVKALSLEPATPEWERNAPTEEQFNQFLSGFRNIYEISLPNIKVPTLAEVIVSDITTDCCLVIDKQNKNSVPSVAVGRYVRTPIVYNFETLPDPKQAQALNDNNLANYAQFSVSSTGPSKAVIVIKTDRPVSASAILVTLDQYVSTPATIELKAIINEEEIIVVSSRTLGGSNPSINFPKTTAKEWSVGFSHTQPLRVISIKLDEDNQGTYQNTVRFLAQPNQSYSLYSSFDPKREKLWQIRNEEAYSLQSGQPLIVGTLSSGISNPSFVEGDSDGDSLVDAIDNCPRVANKNQEDLDSNKIGDACEDFDQDGYINSQDNCPKISNTTQQDTDNDKIGNACDKEESRLTEQYPWISWLGIGFAGVIILFLFILTARKKTSPDTLIN